MGGRGAGAHARLAQGLACELLTDASDGVDQVTDEHVYLSGLLGQCNR